MFLILCSLFEIGAESWHEFYDKIREKNKRQKKSTKNYCPQVGSFCGFLFDLCIYKQEEWQRVFRSRMYFNQSSWTAQILRYSGNGEM